MGFSMRALFVSMSVCALLTAPAIGAAADDALAAGHDIFQHCNFKNPGDDQRSRLTIILRDKDNNEKKNVYRRLWKDYRGEGGWPTRWCCSRSTRPMPRVRPSCAGPT